MKYREFSVENCLFLVHILRYKLSILNSELLHISSQLQHKSNNFAEDIIDKLIGWNIHFPKEVLKSHINNNLNTMNDILQIAQPIYNQFVCIGANSEVNISFHVRQSIIELFVQHDDINMSIPFLQLSIEKAMIVFDEAAAEIERLLIRDTFPRYLASMVCLSLIILLF